MNVGCAFRIAFGTFCSYCWCLCFWDWRDCGVWFVFMYFVVLMWWLLFVMFWGWFDFVLYCVIFCFDVVQFR